MNDDTRQSDIILMIGMLKRADINYHLEDAVDAKDSSIKYKAISLIATKEYQVDFLFKEDGSLLQIGFFGIELVH